LLVPGGTFNRSNDTNYPAKVSDFYLDKYEITVGRFRQFVNAGMGTQANPPAPGSGAHPLIVGSGWDSTWNAELPADAASLKAAMKCNSADQTWTDTAEGNESQPQNCMTWFEAAAFCAWDGGRLPTEAEWNYAAAGGTEQRAYPWSSPPTSTTIDDSYAVYCGGSCNNAQNVGSKSPEGDGKWGQADLAGNVWEWALDYWSDPYLMPCDNCASLSTASARVIRGGYFGYPAYILATSFRYNVSPDYPGGGVGSRCARIGSIEGGGDAGVPDAPVAQPDVSVGGSGGSGGFGGGVATGGSGGAAGGIGGGGAAGGNTTVPTGGTGTSTTISTGTMQGPSCTGLTKTCGPSGNESCCASILVPSGTFYRGYDGVAFTDKGYPATVSDFYLDKYEITVGRFRAFVNAGVGTQANPPAAGAGAHPLIADSGWDSTWNTNLPADTASLKAAMKCDSTFQTWTDTTGGNENRPQNCMTWFEAAAFCAWDGGRLPTEAEWNYAATGGDEQLEYPWGNSIDPNDASYRVDYTQNCVGDGVPTCTLADLIVVGTKPAGNGRWGHADLAGNVWEWTLDWYGNFPMPCNNCANLVSSPSRVVRGGGFENIPYYVLANVRITIPTSDYSDIGSRCARIGSIGGGGDAGRPDAPGAQPDVSVGGSGGSGGSSGGGGGTVASGGVVATGGIVGTGGNTAVCQESATLCSDDGLQTCANGQWGAGVPCSAGLVCERYPQAACFDPTWAEWPMPNSQVDVTAGAPNLESYTDNKDGTITDNVTGLMWQQVVSTTTYTWAQAVAYCPKLTLAGHSDWRLPSRIELVSIVDLGVTSGVPINATYFPSTPVGWFWSSSPWAGSPRYAWGVGFGDVGYTNFSDVPYMTNARCVR
jgi:formylglycine-generating enzyme required for sulfatase activity